MIDDEARENRKRFEEEFSVTKLDFLPPKYFDAFTRKSELDYDHPLLFQNGKEEYFVVSLHPGKRNETILEEGFKPTYPMYNKFCASYYKKFKRTKTHRIEEIEK